MKPQFLVSAYFGDVRIDVSDPVQSTGYHWTLTQSEARDLRDALTLALAPVAAGEPRLPCRITKGRKACRSCGAASGQAHAEGCAEVLQPPEEGGRRVGPPERRAAWAAWAGVRLAAEPPADAYWPVKLSGVIYESGQVDPPTPEEKAAGERIQYPPILPTRCPECGVDLAGGQIHSTFCEWVLGNC